MPRTHVLLRSFLLLRFWAWAIGISFAAPAATVVHPQEFTHVRGANYVPSYARNDLQTWLEYDPRIVDRELGFARKLQLNCVRVFLQFAAYERDPKQFLATFENFLSLCARHHVQMMPVLFDSCFGDLPDLANYRLRDWMACPGQNRLGSEHWPALEQYLRDVVGAHRLDRRILMWDVMNEPTCTRYYREPVEKERIHTFLRHFLDYVESQQPGQPRTVGLASSSELPLVLNQVDVLGFHNYTRALKDDIRGVQKLAREHGKPAILNEVVMLPQQPFSFAMPLVRQERIGWVFWELMFGKTQFSRDPNPIQGLLYPDGTCQNAEDVALVMNCSVASARRLFPERPRPEMVEDGIRFRGFWTRWTGQGPAGNRLFFSSRRGDTATWTLDGNAAVLVHKAGPDCGRFRILVDGRRLAETFDTYSPDVDWNRRSLVASQLSAGRHLLTLEVAGTKQDASSNSWVQVVEFQVGTAQEP